VYLASYLCHAFAGTIIIRCVRCCAFHAASFQTLVSADEYMYGTLGCCSFVHRYAVHVERLVRAPGGLSVAAQYDERLNTNYVPAFDADFANWHKHERNLQAAAGLCLTTQGRMSISHPRAVNPKHDQAASLVPPTTPCIPPARGTQMWTVVQAVVAQWVRAVLELVVLVAHHPAVPPPQQTHVARRSPALPATAEGRTNTTR
jgi:hypothetical protein